MDQPTAEEALKRLEPLVGEWTLEAKPPDGPPWPGQARATIEWHDSGAHLVARSTVDMPEAPDSVSIMGCDGANGTYFQLYSDERGVCRVYEMSIAEDGRWELWREGAPFPQRFAATISDDGETIYVTEGIGLCQRRGGPVEVIRPGDRVFFEPGENHWHGAAPNRFMTHITMLEVDDQGSPVTWGEHVSDEEYGGAPSIDQ
jgi:hypothetical protein